MATLPHYFLPEVVKGNAANWIHCLVDHLLAALAAVDRGGTVSGGQKAGMERGRQRAGEASEHSMPGHVAWERQERCASQSLFNLTIRGSLPHRLNCCHFIEVEIGRDREVKGFDHSHKASTGNDWNLNPSVSDSKACGQTWFKVSKAALGGKPA